MTLTALVAAYGGDVGGLHALRPLAGATVLEHQVRRLVAAGVRRAIVLLDDWPPALAAPLARLRADGLGVEAVRGLGDAADRLATEPRVLLLADGCLPGQALLDRMAQAAMPSLATLPDTPDHAAFERIDAGARWAGVALLDGRRVAEAAAMLGEWDAASTLLRRAVQEGAGRIAAAEPPALATESGALGTAEARLVASSREAPAGWADRFVAQPLVEAALPLMFARRIEPLWPAAAAVLLALGGGCAAMAGFRWGALLPLLAAGPLARTATRLGAVQARALPWPEAVRIAGLTGLALGALGVGRGLAAASGQWGWWLVAALSPALLCGLAVQRRLLVWLGAGVEPLWLAKPAEMPWALLPFALVGAWGGGLVALSLYALLSLAWAMRRALDLSGGRSR